MHAHGHTHMHTHTHTHPLFLIPASFLWWPPATAGPVGNDKFSGRLFRHLGSHTFEEIRYDGGKRASSVRPINQSSNLKALLACCINSLIN